MPAATLVSLEESLNTSYKPDCDYVDGVLERNGRPSIARLAAEGSSPLDALPITIHLGDLDSFLVLRKAPRMGKPSGLSRSFAHEDSHFGMRRFHSGMKSELFESFAGGRPDRCNPRAA